jgi:hypothetical protein
MCINALAEVFSSSAGTEPEIRAVTRPGSLSVRASCKAGWLLACRLPREALFRRNGLRHMRLVRNGFR